MYFKSELFRILMTLWPHSLSYVGFSVQWFGSILNMEEILHQCPFNITKNFDSCKFAMAISIRKPATAEVCHVDHNPFIGYRFVHFYLLTGIKPVLQNMLHYRSITACRVTNMYSS